MFKFTLRSFLYIIMIPLMAVIYYISYGHKQYSLLENYQYLIVDNLKSQYGIDIKYENLSEEWDYLKPYLEIYNLEIKDNEGVEFVSEKISIRLDLIYLIMAQKLKIKKVNIDNSFLKLKYNTKDQKNNSNFDFSIIEHININKLNINNLNIDFEIDEKKYNLKDVNLNYNHSNNFFTIENDNIKIKQFIDDSKYYKTNVESSSESIIAFIKKHGFESYLNDIGYGDIFNSEGNINIISNFKNKDDFNLEFSFKNNKVKLLTEDLSFSDFSGSIYFNSFDKKVYSDIMKCKTNNKDCTFEIKNDNNNIFLNFSAYANEKTLSKYVGFIDNSNFIGETKINGTYDIEENLLSIKSDLQGMEVINIPLLSKNKKEKINLDLKTYLNNNKNYIDLKIGNIQIFVDLIKYNTQVYFNEAFKKYTLIEKDLYISGEIDNLDVSKTLNFIDTLKFEKNHNKNFNYEVNLKLTNPNYFNIIPEIVIYSDKNGLANINIIDNNISGNIIYDLNKNYLSAIIDKFIYNTEGKENNLDNLDIYNWPNINISINDLIINKYQGSISFNANHNNQFYIIDNIKGLLNNIKPNFIVKIDKETLNTSLISINENKLFEFDDISNILKSYGYEKTITSKNGIVYGDVSWEGLYPNIKTLNGKINFEINEGKFNAATTGARVLKVFKIFEINMIAELLKLDFDFVKKGTKYKTLVGNGHFIDGVYYIDKNIEMKSNNYNAAIDGTIDFVNENFENSIKIDLPVSQKLPTLALLTGNPIAIAGVWAADKLLGDQINKLSSIKFNVKGDFENPNVTK